MSQAEARTPFNYSADFMFWMLGWTVHSIASTFIQTQSTIDVLARISTVCFAMALPLAWNTGRKWHAAFFVLMILVQVLGGPPTPRVRSTGLLIAGGVLVGLGAMSILIGLYQRYMRWQQPSPSVAADA